MNTYYNIEISENTFIRIIEYLEDYARELDNYYEIETLVHTIDFLEKEKERAREQNNKEVKEGIKWQRTLIDFCEFLSKKFDYDEEELRKAQVAYIMAIGKEKEAETE